MLRGYFKSYKVFYEPPKVTVFLKHLAVLEKQPQTPTQSTGPDQTKEQEKGKEKEPGPAKEKEKEKEKGKTADAAKRGTTSTGSRSAAFTTHQFLKPTLTKIRTQIKALQYSAKDQWRASVFIVEPDATFSWKEFPSCSEVVATMQTGTVYGFGLTLMLVADGFLVFCSKKMKQVHQFENFCSKQLMQRGMWIFPAATPRFKDSGIPEDNGAYCSYSSCADWLGCSYFCVCRM